jgi:SAM-dependent methyltransferase
MCHNKHEHMYQRSCLAHESRVRGEADDQRLMIVELMSDLVKNDHESWSSMIKLLLLCWSKMTKHIIFYIHSWVVLARLPFFSWSTAEALLPWDRTTQITHEMSRRDLMLFWPVGIAGTFLYGKLVADAAQKLSRGELVYPEAHEQRVAATIATAMLQSIPSDKHESLPLKRVSSLRVLEVGIGKECRVIRRNLYHRAYADVAASGRISQITLTGVDIVSPSPGTFQVCKDVLQKLDSQHHLSTDFQCKTGDISRPLDFPDEYFDCIICTLTLCSVDDQLSALKQMKRLLRHDGGCLGYVEHTAVLPDEPYHFLDFQQQLLDPLQQVVADNCHLHRYTDAAISEIFGHQDETITLSRERFLVEGMWPVSCQSCGVIQRVQA